MRGGALHDRTVCVKFWIESLPGSYLSHRLLADYEAAVEACCAAWNALTAEAGRLRSLTAYPYLEQVNP